MMQTARKNLWRFGFMRFEVGPAPSYERVARPSLYGLRV